MVAWLRVVSNFFSGFCIKEFQYQISECPLGVILLPTDEETGLSLDFEEGVTLKSTSVTCKYLARGHEQRPRSELVVFQ